MKDNINELIKQSMKAKTRTRTEVLRAIKTAFLVHETQKNAKPLDLVMEIAIIRKLRNQRLDNAEQYRMAGRHDLYDIEMQESLILNEFLPEGPSKEDIDVAILSICEAKGLISILDEYTWTPAIPKKQMGTIVKEIKSMIPAADGKLISDIVKSYIVN